MLVINNLLGKLPFDSPTALGESLKNTLVPVFILDFSLLSCELGSFRLSIILIHFILIFYLTVSCKKYKLVSLTSSIMKKIFVFPGRSSFSLKLICCIAFKTSSSTCFLIRADKVTKIFIIDCQ